MYKNFLQKYSVGPALESFFFSEYVTYCRVNFGGGGGGGGNLKTITNHDFRESKRRRVEEEEGGAAERILRIVLLES